MDRKELVHEKGLSKNVDQSNENQRSRLLVRRTTSHLRRDGRSSRQPPTTYSPKTTPQPRRPRPAPLLLRQGLIAAIMKTSPHPRAALSRAWPRPWPAWKTRIRTVAMNVGRGRECRQTSAASPGKPVLTGYTLMMMPSCSECMKNETKPRNQGLEVGRRG